MSVESCGDKQHLRTKFLYDRLEDFVCNMRECFISGVCMQRDIDHTSFRVRCIFYPAGAGIYSPLMCRDEPDVFFVHEGGLGAIAVMSIVIDHHHALQSICKCFVCRNGNIIEDTKPHGAI